MTKNQYLENIASILEDGSVENIPLRNIDFLKSIFIDEDIGVSLYENFRTNFISCIDDTESLYMKTEDLVYRMNLLINDCLIDMNDIQDIDLIKEVVRDLINNEADFYSAVSFDDFDKEIVEEFDLMYNKGGVEL